MKIKTRVARASRPYDRVKVPVLRPLQKESDSTFRVLRIHPPPFVSRSDGVCSRVDEEKVSLSLVPPSQPATQ